MNSNIIHMLQKLLTFLIIDISVSGVSSKMDPCFFWEDSAYANGKCFKGSTNKLPGDEAQDGCQSFWGGGTLAEIRTEEELNHVANIQTKLGSYTMLGATVTAPKNVTFQWRSWKDACQIPIDWWDVLQPNRPGVEGCLLMANNHKFHDGSCTEKFQYICERLALVTDPCYAWPNSSYFNGKCYQTSVHKSTTWNDAQEYCGTLNGGWSLPTFETDDQKKLLVASIKHLNITGNVWMGSTNTQGNGGTGTNATSVHSNSQQNNAGNRVCTALGQDGVPKDVSCSSVQTGLCTEESFNPCDVYLPGAEYFNGRCFLYVQTRMYQDQAQVMFIIYYTKNTSEEYFEFCESKDAFLAEPRYESLNNYVKGMAKRYSEKYGGEAIYIGGNKTRDNTWMWMTSGLPFSMSFTDWSSFEPSSDWDEYYVSLKGNKNWAWNNINRENFSFICQRDIGDPCEELLPGGIFGSEGCVKYLDSQVTRDQAQKACKEDGAFLVEKAHGNLSVGAQKYLNASAGSSEEFACQKGFKQKTKKSYVAVFPEMTQDVTNMAVLQVTSSFLSHAVYLTITTSDGKELKTSVTWLQSLVYDVPKEVELSSTGVQDRYIYIEASHPVSVVVYLRSAVIESSALVYPTKWNDMEGVWYYVTSSRDGSELESGLAVVSVTNATNKVTIYVPDQETAARVSSGQVIYSFSTPLSVSGTLTEAFQTLYTMNYSNVDALVVNASSAVAVLLEEKRTDQSTGVVLDHSFDQTVPPSWISTEYISFPSLPLDSSSDVLRFSSVQNNTVIQIVGKNDHTETVTLDAAGTVRDLRLPGSDFYYLHSNQPFYVLKITQNVSRIDDARSCITSLVSRELWRHQYGLHVTSLLDNFQVYLVVIVQKEKSKTIELYYPDPEVTWSCSGITGTTLSGCYVSLPSKFKYHYHIRLTDYRSRFGAYLYAWSLSSIICHPLGVTSEPVTPTVDFHDITIRENVPIECNTTLTTSWTISSDTTDFMTSEVHLQTTSEVTVESSTETPRDVVTCTPQSPRRDSSVLKEMAIEDAKEINEILQVEAKNTSSFKRTKTSVPDPRLSAKVIGCGGVLFVGFSLFVVVASDVVDLVRYCCSLSTEHRTL